MESSRILHKILFATFSLFETSTKIQTELAFFDKNLNVKPRLFTSVFQGMGNTSGSKYLRCTFSSSSLQIFTTVSLSRAKIPGTDGTGSNTKYVCRYLGI